MFLYLLNDKEGKAFIELAIQAMNIKGDNNTYCDKAEYEGFLTELNLPDYQAVGLSLEDATAEFKSSSKQVKRSVIIELCCILYADKELDNDKMQWIYKLAEKFGITKPETERLVSWSKDFSDFIEVGLLYINA